MAARRDLGQLDSTRVRYPALEFDICMCSGGCHIAERGCRTSSSRKILSHSVVLEDFQWIDKVLMTTTVTIIMSALVVMTTVTVCRSHITYRVLADTISCQPYINFK